jgi:hypothetical protein
LLAVDVWTGLAAATQGDANWSNPVNWSLAAVPGPSDTASFTNNNQVKAFISIVDKPFTVANVSVDSSWNGAVAVNQSLTMSQGLNLASGSFGGDGSMQTGGTSNWTAGTLRVGGRLTNIGDFNLNGGSVDGLHLGGAGALVNQGFVVQNCNLFFDDATAIQNAAGGTYQLPGDYGFFHGAVAGLTARIINSGNFEKIAANSSIAVGSQVNVGFLNNAGFIASFGGVLTFDGPISLSGVGEFDVKSGDLVDLKGSGPTSLTGTYKGVGGGLVNLEGDVTIGQGGAALSFEPGMLQWRSGLIDVSRGNLTNVGAIAIAKPSTNEPAHVLRGGGSLVNKGAIDQAANLFLGASLDNQSGGVYQLESSTSILPDGGGGTFINDGVLQKISDTGTASIRVNLQNSGRISVPAGTFTLATTGGTSGGGKFEVNPGAFLSLTPTHATVLNGTYTGSGGGSVTFSAGTLAIGGAGAVFNFPAGMFHWRGGTIDVSQGNLFNRQVITLSGTDPNHPPTLTGAGSLTNSSGTGITLLGATQTIIQAGSSPLQLFAGASLRNTASGIIELRTDAGITSAPSGNSTLTNIGILRKVGGSGTSTISATLDNSGTVAVGSGTLNFTGPVVQAAGTTLTGGTWSVTAPPSTAVFLSISSASSLGTIAAGASVALSGSNASFTNLNPPTSNTGTFSIKAGERLTTLGNFQNSGTLLVGATSNLTGAAGYTQSASGVLHIQSSGEVLTGRNGEVSLAGALVIDPVIGSLPPGSSFMIISNGSLTSAGKPAPVQGTFAGLPEGKTFTSPGGQLQITYKGGDGNDVVLTVIAPAFANRQITSPIIKGAIAALSGTIERVKPRDAFFLDVDWGDGSRRQKFSFPPPARTIHIRHHYRVAGTFTVALRWRDQRGHFNTTKLPIVVL